MNQENKQGFLLRPASLDEAGLFFSLSPEQDREMATVGHVRLDFGGNGKEFWHTWWPHNGDVLNTPEFAEELGRLVDQLRQDGPLQDSQAMSRFCCQNGGEITGGWRQNYGYIAESENYRFCLRCNPGPGDYQGYLTCYDLRQQRLNMAQMEKPIIGRTSYANSEAFEFDDAAAFIKEELPYHASTGFRYKTVTGDPAVRKAVDDMLYDLFGEDNPRLLEEYEQSPGRGMTFGGM